MPTISDVIISGVALTSLVKQGGTPALATCTVPRRTSASARTRCVTTDVSVLIFQLTLRLDTPDGRRIALTNCSFESLSPQWSECRLIGRTSTAKLAQLELIPGETGIAHCACPTVRIPSDLQQGDLIAVPCFGAATLLDVRSVSWDPETAGTRAQRSETLAQS